MATGNIEGEESKNNKVYTRKNHNKPKNPTFVPQQSTHLTLATTTTTDDNNSSQPLLHQTFDVVASDDSSSHNRLQQGAQNATNGIGKAGYVKYDNLVKINLNVLSKNEVRLLKRKLATELEQVRGLVKRFEVKESRLSGGYANSRVSGNENVDRGGVSLVRVNSDVGSVGLPSSRSFHGLSVSVVEHDHSNHGDGGGGSEFVEKEKRTPKANQYYKNSEFVSGKEKLKPTESNKKMKPKVGKSNGGQMGGGISTEKFSNQLFKSCSDLLGKLMKHKFGWVFNKPVDVKGLGLHDYYSIVKHPMDLGTVKSRLSKNWYKSPREFAEDVRLTFSNAMLYNPKGQDVHFMADTLSGIFEENWAGIESDYNLNRRLERNHEYSLPTPTSRRIPAPAPAPVQAHALPTPASAPAPSPLPFEARTLERSESMTMTVDPKSRAVDLTPTGRIAVPKKPKAKDPDKRDMTYEEKQRLSVNLQNLPSEKLDSIVQIIKKRNPALFQQEDEIEVDIDSVDPETLWELDRFVTNYKKSLSKNKKKAEIAHQANAEADHNIHKTILEPLAEDVMKVAETVEKIVPTSPPIHGERLQNNESGSSSSSSSSSDSGSSSSDSDSDGSSG
ncbi:transcription factor GTE5, chloroplastic-like isoform X2 [Durio zibethinus]|uniref:Transcription factor GTE5, chloroplastic-like isoform X2 n=1 Tax=Durio zibethinus TaxID=66656 RepID=A0A6P5WMI8_DURZI|nr:transcription factor GTE5, chloroplastic-like isoform X2 [Durio zibethinus]